MIPSLSSLFLEGFMHGLTPEAADISEKGAGVKWADFGKLR